MLTPVKIIKITSTAKSLHVKGISLYDVFLPVYSIPFVKMEQLSVSLTLMALNMRGTIRSSKLLTG